MWARIHDIGCLYLPRCHSVVSDIGKLPRHASPSFLLVTNFRPSSTPFILLLLPSIFLFLPSSFHLTLFILNLTFTLILSITSPSILHTSSYPKPQFIRLHQDGSIVSLAVHLIVCTNWYHHHCTNWLAIHSIDLSDQR